MNSFGPHVSKLAPQVDITDLIYKANISTIEQDFSTVHLKPHVSIYQSSGECLFGTIVPGPETATNTIANTTNIVALATKTSLPLAKLQQ